MHSFSSFLIPHFSFLYTSALETVALVHQNKRSFRAEPVVNTGLGRAERDNNHGTACDKPRAGACAPSRDHVICEWFFQDASHGKDGVLHLIFWWLLNATSIVQKNREFIRFEFSASSASLRLCGKNGLGLAWVIFSASQGEDLRMEGGTGKQKKVERHKG